MLKWVAAFAIMQVPPQTPSEALAAAHADLRRLPVELRASVRYLSLYNVPGPERTNLYQTLSGHCNSLSTEPDITKPAYLGTVVRVNLLDYGWDAKVWDKIADPFFTVTVETPWGTYDRYGNFRQTKLVRERALAPWLAETDQQRAMLAEVVAWTQSKSPIVRADYFLSLTSAGEDRTPNYYDFLGIKNERDFLALGAVDVKAAAKVHAINRDAVSVSEITKYDRGIVAIGKIRGTFWKTLDHAKANAGNALRILGQEAESHYDASEQIVALPNRLLAFGLFNAKGERQDTAPNNIVRTPVAIYRDCIACHKGGFRDLDSWIQPQLRGPLDIRSPDPETARQLRREYLEGLAELIAEDRARYTKRLKELTGLESDAYAVALTTAIQRYEDVPVDLAAAAVDLGVTPATWKAAMEQRAAAGQLSTILAPMLIGGRLTRATWETEIANAHAILKERQN